MTRFLSHSAPGTMSRSFWSRRHMKSFCNHKLAFKETIVKYRTTKKRGLARYPFITIIYSIVTFDRIAGMCTKCLLSIFASSDYKSTFESALLTSLHSTYSSTMGTASCRPVLRLQAQDLRLHSHLYPQNLTYFYSAPHCWWTYNEQWSDDREWRISVLRWSYKIRLWEWIKFKDLKDAHSLYNITIQYYMNRMFTISTKRTLVHRSRCLIRGSAALPHRSQRHCHWIVRSFRKLFSLLQDFSVTVSPRETITTMNTSSELVSWRFKSSLYND